VSHSVEKSTDDSLLPSCHEETGDGIRGFPVAASTGTGRPFWYTLEREPNANGELADPG